MSDYRIIAYWQLSIQIKDAFPRRLLTHGEYESIEDMVTAPSVTPETLAGWRWN